MPNAIRSFVLQDGVWWTPERRPEPAKPRPLSKSQQACRLADTIRGAMLDRFDRIVYDDGPVAAMLRDLEQHLAGSGWTGQEIIDVLREEFFPEFMQAPADYQQRLSLVPRRGGGGASLDRMRAFIEKITASQTPNLAERLENKDVETTENR